jgi:hypothetical protein
VTPEMNISKLPMSECLVEPVVALAHRARYGGELVVKMVNVRPRPGTGLDQPADIYGQGTSVTMTLSAYGGVPSETRYVIAIERDNDAVEMALTYHEVLAIAKTLRHVLGVR